VATATKMKKIGKKSGRGTTVDVRALSMSLADVAATGGGRGMGNGAKTPTARRRTALVARETTRMQAVLAHPTFRSNPIAAISNHIISGVADDARRGRSDEDARARAKAEPKRRLTPQQERDRSGAHVLGPAAPSERRAMGRGRTAKASRR
jgi:hypothetical protein